MSTPIGGFSFQLWDPIILNKKTITGYSHRLYSYVISPLSIVSVGWGITTILIINSREQRSS
jgi:hypothetical protein